MSLWKKTAKKVTAAVLLTGMVATSVIGCGSSSTESGGKKAESTETESKGKGGKILFMGSTSERTGL